MDSPPVAPSAAPPRAVSVRRPTQRKVAPPRKTSRRQATPWESDAEMVAAILAGSRQHFDLLYEAYFPRVYRFALKRLRDPSEAEDVTQEVFVTVFQSLQSYQGNSSLLVWIFGITRNKVNRRFRGVGPPLPPNAPHPHRGGGGAPPPQAGGARRRRARWERGV
ncbi:MAG: RNA polymerase sigma factor, partial [Myxococcota bacterium]|nr:RNA polymerase sigma factor [Myxococcota bacterium]